MSDPQKLSLLTGSKHFETQLSGARTEDDDNVVVPRKQNPSRKTLLASSFFTILQVSYYRYVLVLSLVRTKSSLFSCVDVVFVIQISNF